MKLKYEVAIPAIDQAWFRAFSEELFHLVTTLRFDSNGVLQLAGIDGLERSQLRLVNGRHLEPGAEYVLPTSSRTVGGEPNTAVVLNTWNESKVAATVTEGRNILSLTAKRNSRYGLSELHVDKVARGGSAVSRVQWSAEVDAGDWFNERRTAGTVTVTHALAVAKIRFRQRRDGGLPFVEINCSVKGSGAARPLVAGGLWANSARIRRYLERDLRSMTERFRQKSVPDPEIAARRLLVAVLAPERLKFLP